MSDQDEKEPEGDQMGSLRAGADRGQHDGPQSESGQGTEREGVDLGQRGVPTDSHLSFIKRLQKRVGRELDPGIELQKEGSRGESDRAADEVGPASTPVDRGASGSSPSSSSGRRLIEKLADSVSLSTRYRLSDEIARGGMGKILRVWDDDLRRNLAMKVMHGVARTDASTRASGPDDERLVRFLEEAQITGQLDHPGVVPVHDLGIDPKGRCYFTMRLVRGRELKEILKLARNGEEGWTMTRALGVILKVCEAMAFAHSKGVIHRDLKPANIMVGRFGETYVMDWGLARVLGRDDAESGLPKDASSLSIVRTDRRDTGKDDPDSPLVTLEGDVVGTPSYMAPEQARGDLANLGPRADVYALGSILYELLTDRVPYLKKDERISAHAVLSRVLNGEPEPVAKLAQDQPAELVAICEKAMAREQEDRYPSMLAVAEDIQAYLEDRVVKAYGGGAVVEIKKWIQRNRGAAAALGALLVLAIATAIGFNLQTSRQLERLERQEAQTRAARDEANDSLARAKDSEAEAQAALAKARMSADAARKSEANARRSGYSANLLAAVYSIRLGDMQGARERLDACDLDMRGWEWRKLDLECDPTLRREVKTVGFGSRAFPLRDGKTVLLFERSGRVRLVDYDSLESLTNKQDQISVGELSVSGSLVYASSWEQRSSAALRPNTDSVAMFASGPFIHLIDLNSRDDLELSLLPWLDQIEVDARSKVALDNLQDASKRSYIRSLAWSPDGRFLATGGFDGSVLIFDLDEDEPSPRIMGGKQRGAVLGVVWDDTGETLASVSEGGEFALWSPVSGRAISREKEHEGPATDVVFDPLRGAYLSCGRDGKVLRWGRKGGQFEATVARIGEPLQAIAVRGHSGDIAVVSAPDGADSVGRCLLIQATEKINSVVGLLSSLLSEESTTTEVLLGAEGGLFDVFFGADGTTVAAYGASNALLVWDLEGPLSQLELGRDLLGKDSSRRNGNAQKPLDWDGVLAHEAIAGAADPTGQLIATAGEEGDVLIWDRARGFPTARLRGHTARVGRIAFSPDGKLLASGSQDATIRLWNTETASLVRVLRGHKRWIQFLSFSPDGTRLYSVGGEKEMRTWDVASGELLGNREIRAQTALVNALSRDGEFMASGSREIEVRKTKTDEELIRLPRKSGRVRSLAFATDNKSLWAGYSKGILRKWSLESGELLSELHGNKLEVLNAVVGSDGTRLLTSAAGKSVRVRDFESGHVLLELELPARVRHLVLGPEDSYLLVVLMDGRVLLLESNPGDRRQIAQMRTARAEERSQRGVIRTLLLNSLARHGYPSEVRAEISSNPNLTEDQRRIARAILDVEIDVPGYLAGLARAAVDNPKVSSDEAQRALFQAQAAKQLQPDDPRLDVVLGIVQLRAGLPAAALTSLSQLLDKDRSDWLDVERSVGEDGLLRANCYLVLAMLEVGATDRLEGVQAEITSLLNGNPALRVRPGLAELRAEVDQALEDKGA